MTIFDISNDTVLCLCAILILIKITEIVYRKLKNKMGTVIIAILIATICATAIIGIISQNNYLRKLNDTWYIVRFMFDNDTTYSYQISGNADESDVIHLIKNSPQVKIQNYPWIDLYSQKDKYVDTINLDKVNKLDFFQK